MTLFLDVHRNMHDATEEEVRQAHISDLQAQEAHGVKYLKYWFDKKRGTVCCLIEAPNKEACHATHREAHGMVAEQIINVENEMITAFLGGGTEDDLGAVLYVDGAQDTAYRVILFTDIVGSTSLGENLGDDELYRLVKIHDDLVRNTLLKHAGRDVKHTGDGILASFTDVFAAVSAAQDMQKAFARHREENPNDPLHLSIGMSAGEPISKSNDLYGSAVNLAARVCAEAGKDEIKVAGVVRDLCMGKTLRFESCGEKELKGFAEPVNLFRVLWKD
jgi:class 3 adenylate cyclase